MGTGRWGAEIEQGGKKSGGGRRPGASALIRYAEERQAGGRLLLPVLSRDGLVTWSLYCQKRAPMCTLKGYTARRLMRHEQRFRGCDRGERRNRSGSLSGHTAAD